MKSFKEFIQTPTGIMATLAIIIPSIIAMLIWLYPLSQEKRGLDVSVSQNVELNASPALSKNGSLVFTYNGEQVPNLVSTKIRIKNSGSLPINKEDFIQALTILFPTDTRIINQTIIQVEPLTNFQQGFIEKKNNNQLAFTPVLINPEEIFDIDILTTREGFNEGEVSSYETEDIKFEHKIYGISRLNYVSEIETNNERQIIARQKIRGWADAFPRIIIAILITLLIILILSLIPNRSQNLDDSKKEISKLKKIATAFIFYGFILIIVIYFIGKIIFDAYFLIN